MKARKETPPAAQGAKMCDAHHDGWLCTRPANHDGDHVAHAGREEADEIARWSK